MKANHPVQIDESEEMRRGLLIAAALNLKDKNKKGLVALYDTDWGAKNPIGLYRMMERLVIDGE